MALSTVHAPAAAAALSYREALHRAMRNAMASHDHAFIIGQGVADHKGIFGTTSGLLEEFGAGRVIETPLAEEAITGICVGASLNGLYPINTHIRADFSLLAFNQIINLAAKYKYMFGGLFEVPMLIRLVVGRSWGQGAQHSQSLQSLFAHIPGLTVLMPATPQSILDSYEHAVAKHRGPVIAIEHRLMYELNFSSDGWAGVKGRTPFSSRRVRNGKDITVVASSIMVLEAMRASEHLARHGVDCEVIDAHCLSHLDTELILESVKRTGRLVVADTSWAQYGLCAEICRIVLETDPRMLKAPVATLGMQPAPCPTAKALEDLYYPTVADLCDAVLRTVDPALCASVPRPDARSMTDFYKKFRGPF